jgi:hypothetical protein
MKLVLLTDANSSHFWMLDELKAEGIDVIPAFDVAAQRHGAPERPAPSWPAKRSA